MAETERLERIEPYLRPHQVEDMADEKRQIEGMLTSPPHIRAQIQDRGAMLKQHRALDERLRRDMPLPYEEGQRDAAAKREAELRDKFLQGMPTQEEMRKAPAGAVDKHRSWEAANKIDIAEWKNIRLRMHATGMLDGPRDASDIANIERFRPIHASHELPMHNKIVEGKQYFMPSGPVAVTNASEEQAEKLAQVRAEAKAQPAPESSPEPSAPTME